MRHRNFTSINIAILLAGFNSNFAQAAPMTVFKDSTGQVLLTNVVNKDGSPISPKWKEFKKIPQKNTMSRKQESTQEARPENRVYDAAAAAAATASLPAPYTSGLAVTKYAFNEAPYKMRVLFSEDRYLNGSIQKKVNDLATYDLCGYSNNETEFQKFIDKYYENSFFDGSYLRGIYSSKKDLEKDLKPLLADALEVRKAYMVNNLGISKNMCKDLKSPK